jgi:hypothetical protein
VICGAAGTAIRSAVWFFLLLALAPAEADSSNTGCEFRNFLGGYYVANDRRIFDDEKFIAIAHKLVTAVYRDATGEAPAASTLRFSQRLTIADPGEGVERIKIKDLGGQVLGWVNRDAVLCRIYPMSDPDSGLYWRAVVRPGPGQVQVKKVFQSPDERCEGGTSNCVEVRRFQWYFVYGEENGHYLIAETPNLGNTQTRLLGWLPVGDAYNWNTALAIRPAEDLATRHATPQDPHHEDFVCAYQTREELNSGANCHALLGGRRWFSLDVRIPVLKQDNQAYEAIFPQGERMYIPVSGDVVPEILLSRDQLEGWVKILDVFKTFSAHSRGQMARDFLVSAMLTSLGDVLQMDFQSDRVPLGKRMQFAAGLPHGAQSILMQYSPEDLRDPAKVPACEIDRLAEYAAKKHDALDIVLESNGKLLAAFDEKRRPEGGCTNLSNKGRNIPFIDSAVRALPLNVGQPQKNYTVMRKIGNDFLFWIPVRYLP